MRLMTQASGCLKHQVLQPGSGVFVALNAEIGVANHIRQQKGFHFFAGTVILQFFGKVAAAPERVVSVPLPGE